MMIGWNYCEIHLNHIDAVKLLTIKSNILFLALKKLLIDRLCSELIESADNKFVCNRKAASVT